MRRHHEVHREEASFEGEPRENGSGLRTRNEVSRLFFLQDRRRVKASDAPQKHCQTESETKTADRTEQRNGIREAKTGAPGNDTRLGKLLQDGRYEEAYRAD